VTLPQQHFTKCLGLSWKAQDNTAGLIRAFAQVSWCNAQLAFIMV
jgi:hypothetical protein